MQLRKLGTREIWILIIKDVMQLLPLLSIYVIVFFMAD